VATPQLTFENKRPLKRIKRELDSRSATSSHNQMVNFNGVPTVKILKKEMDKLHLNTEQRNLNIAEFERI
jgi:hypothetical protein